MFLHLINADPKFLEPIRRVFELSAPGSHEYVVIGRSVTGWELPAGVAFAASGADASVLARRRDDWDGVLVHGVPFETLADILPDLPDETAVAWYVWGFEAYGSWPVLSRQLLKPATRAALKRLPGRRAAAARRSFAAGLRSPRVRRTCDRLDYCVTQVREEYELFRSTGLVRNASYCWGSVGALEDYADLGSGIGSGTDIQVGNSAAVTNNHIDTMQALARMDLGSSRVVVPLGYGDDGYREVVIAEGTRLLGARFSPLQGFVALEEYQRLTSECGHLIMDHRRQQGLGTIIGALWRGASVLMNDTTAFRAFTRQGLDIRLLESELGSERRLQPLPVAQAERHREILRRYLGRDRVVLEAQRLLERLRGGRPVGVRDGG